MTRKSEGQSADGADSANSADNLDSADPASSAPSQSFTDRDREAYSVMPGLPNESTGFRHTGTKTPEKENPAKPAADLAERFHKSEQDLPVKEMAEKSYGHRDFDASAPAGSRGPGIPYALSNNPRAGQWDGRKMSKGKIAAYKRFVVTDGEGVRNSIYVSGCPFRCKNCWNASIWNFSVGHDFTPAFEKAVIDDLKPDYIEGITFLGGEPMLNTPVLLQIAHDVRRVYGTSKNIWCWTGYTWEELMRPGTTDDKLELLHLTDILIDGRFMNDKKNMLLQFRGSSNQRVIDVQKTFAAQKKAQENGQDPRTVAPVIWAHLHDQRRVTHEIGIEQRGHAEGKF